MVRYHHGKPLAGSSNPADSLKVAELAAATLWQVATNRDRSFQSQLPCGLLHSRNLTTQSTLPNKRHARMPACSVKLLAVVVPLCMLVRSQ